MLTNTILMPDISLCTNTTCPLRDGCLRFTATPSERQSYTKFEYSQRVVKYNGIATGVERYCFHFIDINTQGLNSADPNWEPSQGIPSRYMNKLLGFNP